RVWFDRDDWRHDRSVVRFPIDNRFHAAAGVLHDDLDRLRRTRDGRGQRAGGWGHVAAADRDLALEAETEDRAGARPRVEAVLDCTGGDVELDDIGRVVVGRPEGGSVRVEI